MFNSLTFFAVVAVPVLRTVTDRSAFCQLDALATSLARVRIARAAVRHLVLTQDT